MRTVNELDRHQQTQFEMITNDADQIISLKNSRDPHHMNWVKPDSEWGKIKTAKQLTVNVSRRFDESGNLIETYQFTNNTSFEIDTLDTQLGIYIPFSDYYTDADISLTQCCHTHIWCGGDSSYVMALRMGGQAPNLGLVLTTGRFQGYSIERSYDFEGDAGNVSNDRGKFIFHPENLKLKPGETYTLEWQLFWFEDKADFLERLHTIPNFMTVTANQFVLFQGEPIKFTVQIVGQAINQLTVLQAGKSIPVHVHGSKAEVIDYPKKTGDYQYEIRCNHKRTQAVFHVTKQLETLGQKRVSFITKYQQRHDIGSQLNGAYLIYDNDAHTQYYDHLNDHNGGRERVGMAVLVADYLRRHPNTRIQKSLDQYMTYLFEQLFDEKTGIVFNDAPRNNDDPRLYNAPWVGQLLLTVYQLDPQARYLDDYVKLVTNFYAEGGSRFYAIGLPMLESIQIFRRAHRETDAQKLLEMYRRHVDTLIKIDRHYPRSEVAYEQSIVAPAVIYMAEMYLITNEPDYKRAALDHLQNLALFQGFQPDFHLNETPIRHWDGYWFGKKRMLGDTFPHYWAVLSGIAYQLAFQLTGNVQYQKVAQKTLQTSLSLFMTDGSASCAYLYPMAVNDRTGCYFDPWANDQDWGLYYALKYIDK